MKGAFINCPHRDCGKLLIKNCYLRVGTYLTLKCFHCGNTINVRSEAGRITLSMDKVAEKLTDEEDSGIMFLKL